jgi:hypothetical protein
MFAGKEPLLSVLRLRREALVVGERGAVEIEDPVHFRPLGQCVEPLDLVVRDSATEQLVDLHDLGPVEGRLAEPALAVPADPCGVRKRTEPFERLQRRGARRPVVAAEQIAVGARIGRLGEHFV